MNIQNNPGIMQSSKPLSRIIGELAVIAAVQTTSLGMTRLDKSASQQSDDAHNAASGTGRVNVNRLPGAKPAVDAIKAHHTAARTLVAGNTTKWGNDRRLLMNQRIGEVTGQFEDIVREHDRIRDQFVADADIYIRNARHRLGSYDIAPPTQSEIAGAFSLSLELAPVPAVDAYTCGGNSELEKAMRQRFEADIQSAYEGAQKDLLSRLAEPLEKLAERMNAYDEREGLIEKDVEVGKTGTFKSTVITNITDIAKIFREFNVTHDSFLDSIADRLDAFEGIEHKDLTKSQALRADTARRAKEIRGMLEGWL